MHLLIAAVLLAAVFFSSNAVSAQNETQPTIWFDHASYATKKMNCDYYATGKISPQDQEQTRATIIVTDPSANKFSTSIDRVAIFVSSDSDPKGIEITAYETDVNSGIFKGIVTISDGPSTQGIIHVVDGDTISASYKGTTPWSPDTTNRGITATAFIGALCPPLERVPASGVQVTDNEGNEQKTILADKQILIRSNLTNVTIRNQTFAYIVQIQDKGGILESLSWLSGVLSPSKTLSPSVSWTPPRAGNYAVNIFVWQSIDNPNALSPPLSTDLTVLPASHANSTVRNAENLQCQPGYELVTRSNDNSTACVTPQTAQKLVERGWAQELEPNTNYVQDIRVSSIKMVPPYTPGGPIIQLTLENIGTKSITSLKAILELYNNYTFDFTDVSSSSPLVPNGYTSNRTMLVGGGFQTEVAYPLVIGGIEDNASFAYTEQVHIRG